MSKCENYEVAIAVAVGLLQALFAFRFLLQIWAATSIDQVRLSLRPLLYTGLALYLFLLVRLFPPRTASHEDVARAPGPELDDIPLIYLVFKSNCLVRLIGKVRPSTHI